MLVPFALLALLVLGAWAPLHRLDTAVTDALHGYAADHPAWVGLMRVWTDVFAPMPLRAAALLLVVWLLRRGARRLALWVATTMVVGGLLGRCSSCWSAGTGRSCWTRWPGPPATRSRPGTR